MPPQAPRHSFGVWIAALCAGLLGASLAGCHHAAPPDSAPEIARLQSELAATQAKLQETEKSLAAKRDELALSAADLEAARLDRQEKEQIISQQAGQLAATRTQIDDLKKRDSFVFGEIRALQQQGRSVIAFNQYRKFLQDYPNSPLAPFATAAMAEINTESDRTEQRLAAAADPKKQERQTLQLLRDGLMTPKEIAPLIRGKSRAQVLALLGPPSNVFPDVTDLGYADGVTNPANGRRGMLIISFSGNTVSSLRVDYAGQPIVP